MILPLIAFVLTFGILITEGWMLARFFTSEKRLQWLLAPSGGAITNVLLIFVYTLAGLPLMFWTLIPGHAAILAVLWLLESRRIFHAPVLQVTDAPQKLWMGSKLQKGITAVSLVLLTVTCVFSFVHAIILPSISFDVFTNWTHRAQVSWSDQAIAFDDSEIRGVAKPQYPFLVHGLQIFVHQGQRDWSDRAANTVTWILTITSLGAALMMLRKLSGTLNALIAITVMTQIPLFGIHLSAGYADVHLAMYAVLALLALAQWERTRDSHALALSSLLVLGSLWTKSEGLYFVFAPWAVALGILWLKNRGQLKPLLWALVTPLLCFVPFLGLILSKGLPLTPHSSDGSFGIQWEGFKVLPTALWSDGSFGIIWFVIPIVMISILLKKKTPSLKLEPWNLALLAMCLLSLLGVLFIYLFTPNVGFLLNGQSFYRQMLLPAALLITWCALMLGSKNEMVEYRS